MMLYHFLYIRKLVKHACAKKKKKKEKVKHENFTVPFEDDVACLPNNLILTSF